ncbi:hypothetical protein E0H71_00335 [Rhizobium leguminosarum bv. viciae]|uniref:hypothetical protein n=1 Tax=Rhizobium leguminosarum TaxID=384 RepID=UPI00103E4F57|nr:hypothetical protein [Rhizobium leguminosarum]TCA58084.1 hypothetical protein E0H71_00335 [Rhizobium leguminosarum bv. viciae]
MQVSKALSVALSASHYHVRFFVATVPKWYAQFDEDVDLAALGPSAEGWRHLDNLAPAPPKKAKENEKRLSASGQSGHRPSDGKFPAWSRQLG